MSNQPRPRLGSASRRPRWLSSDLHLVICFPDIFFLMDHHRDFERQLETGQLFICIATALDDRSGMHCTGEGSEGSDGSER